MALLEVAGLRREYGRLVALAGLDLTIEAGECVALVGANVGSGKSTAVRAIAGMLEPSAGTVRVCGHDPHRERTPKTLVPRSRSCPTRRCSTTTSPSASTSSW